MDQKQAKLVALTQEFAEPLMAYDVSKYYAGPNLYHSGIALPKHLNPEFYQAKVDEFTKRVEEALQEPVEDFESNSSPVNPDVDEAIKAAVKIAELDDALYAILGYANLIQQGLNVMEDNNSIWSKHEFNKAKRATFGNTSMLIEKINKVRQDFKNEI